MQNYPFNISGVNKRGSAIPSILNIGITERGHHYKFYTSIFYLFCKQNHAFENGRDLTSTAFSATLKHFMSKRGKYSKLYTGNDKNFIEANAEPKTLCW